MKTMCLRCDLPIDPTDTLTHPTEADCIIALKAELKELESQMQVILVNRMEAMKIIHATYQPLEERFAELEARQNQYREFILRQKSELDTLRARG